MWVQNKVSRILLTTLLFVSVNYSSGLLEWLFGTQPTKLTENPDAKEPTTRFEVLSTDEKFLDFATVLVDLSPLDACYHVVIYQLKKRCGELTEEELGKLSVQLLNCQSEVEHRPVFTCTLDMTLADCTKDMDAVTWNSYQIVGNRARAMCYATQQMQFRRLTEKSVNQLAAATTAQLQYMQELKIGQEHLHSMTTETVRRLFESQQELLVTHETLKAKQADVFASVADNVQQLQEEKALIAAGNQQLALLAEKIRDELNSTAHLIKTQGSEQQAKHEAILQDLQHIQEQAIDALSRLDTSSQKLLSHHATLQQQQQQVVTNLHKINRTVMEVMGAVTGLQTHFEGRIAWVTQLLGGADDKLVVLQCCLLHLAYFLLLVVVAAFLHTPILTRVLLMLVVVANMAGQLTHKSSLDFAGLTVFMVSIVCGQWLLHKMRTIVRRRQQGSGHAAEAIMFSSSSADSSTPLSAEEVRHLSSLLQRLSYTMRESLGAEAMANGTVPRSPPSPLHNPAVIRLPVPGPSGDTGMDLLNVRQRLLTSLARGDDHSNHSSRASTPSQARLSRGSTPSLSSRCLGRTLAGGQCRLSATPGSDYCRRHTPGS